MKLIDKVALVAEIERRISQLESKYKELANLEIWITAKEIEHKINGLKEALSIINTLEVKEADLEHEVESYWKQCDMTWCRDAYSMTHIRSMLSDIAKHFYELGMAACNKTQKGEEV